MSNVSKEELAFVLLWKILEEKGGSAKRNILWTSYMTKIDEIKRREGIDLSGVDWIKVLKKFEYDPKKKEHRLPKVVLKPIPDVEELIERMRLVKVRIRPEDEIEFLRKELAGIRRQRDELESKLREIEFLTKSSKDFLEVWGDHPQEVLKRLSDESYILTFPDDLRPAYFEFLVTEAFSCIFQLPLYTEEVAQVNEMKYKVVWRGKIDSAGKPVAWARGRGADTIVYAHGFHVLLEATLTSGIGQWAREFASNFRHLEVFIKENKLRKEDVYMAFIAPEISSDTFASLRDATRRKLNAIPFPVIALKDMVETATYVTGLPHVEVRRLLDDICETLKTATKPEKYFAELTEYIQNWRKEVLNAEKDVFLARKAYQILSKAKRGFMTASEIADELERDEEVKRYSEIIEESFGPERVGSCLLSYGLAQRVGAIRRDVILKAVPLVEFRSKTLKMLGAFGKPVE